MCQTTGLSNWYIYSFFCCALQKETDCFPKKSLMFCLKVFAIVMFLFFCFKCFSSKLLQVLAFLTQKCIYLLQTEETAMAFDFPIKIFLYVAILPPNADIKIFPEQLSNNAVVLECCTLQLKTILTKIKSQLKARLH